MQNVMAGPVYVCCIYVDCVHTHVYLHVCCMCMYVVFYCVCLCLHVCIALCMGVVCAWVLGMHGCYMCVGVVRAWVHICMCVDMCLCVHMCVVCPCVLPAWGLGGSVFPEKGTKISGRFSKRFMP